MNRHGARALCATLVAGGALAATALAADPDKGTVSAEAPKVTWKGEVGDGSYFTYVALATEPEPGTVPCEQGCDTFTLTVAKQADLTIGADSPGEDTADPDGVVLRVQKPDGSFVTTEGDSTKGKPLTVKFKNAATGDYVINYANNYAAAQTYDGFAQLGLAAPAQAPGQNPSTNQPPPPSPSPVPGGQQQGNPPQPGLTPSGQGRNIDITIKAGKASARKLRKSRKLKATVKVSREVAKLRGFLRRGKKTIGKASRGRTNGTVRVTLKLSKKAARKLRKGTLALTFVADDGTGTVASKTVKVRVGK